MIHSKVIATLILCLSLVGSVLIFNQKDTLFGQHVATATSTLALETEQPIRNTSISNPDWKKSLDALSKQADSVQILTKNSTNDTKEDTSLTSQMSKTFFSLYLERQKSGVTIDENEALNIANQTLSQVKIPTSIKIYAVTDLIVTPDSTKETVQKWADQVALILKNQFPTSRTNDTLLLYKALQTQKTSDIALLDPSIGRYKNTIAAIVKLPTPKTLVPYALVYLNTLNNIMFDMQGMRNVLTDPAMGYIYFSNYEKDAVKLEVIVEQMNTDFKN